MIPLEKQHPDPHNDRWTGTMWVIALGISLIGATLIVLAFTGGAR